MTQSLKENMTVRDLLDEHSSEELYKFLYDAIQSFVEEKSKSIKIDDRIMSPYQLFERLLNSNLYDLMAFLVWYTKRGSITCIDCIQTRKLISGKPPNCVKCGLPTARLLEKYFKINPYKEKLDGKKTK